MNHVVANVLLKCVDEHIFGCQQHPTYRDVHVCETSTPGAFLMQGFFLARSSPLRSSLLVFPCSEYEYMLKSTWHILQLTIYPNPLPLISCYPLSRIPSPAQLRYIVFRSVSLTNTFWRNFRSMRSVYLARLRLIFTTITAGIAHFSAVENQEAGASCREG